MGTRASKSTPASSSTPPVPVPSQGITPQVPQVSAQQTSLASATPSVSTLSISTPPKSSGTVTKSSGCVPEAASTTAASSTTSDLCASTALLISGIISNNTSVPPGKILSVPRNGSNVIALRSTREPSMGIAGPHNGGTRESRSTPSDCGMSNSLSTSTSTSLTTSTSTSLSTSTIAAFTSISPPNSTVSTTTTTITTTTMDPVATTTTTTTTTQSTTPANTLLPSTTTNITSVPSTPTTTPVPTATTASTTPVPTTTTNTAHTTVAPTALPIPATTKSTPLTTITPASPTSPTTITTTLPLSTKSGSTTVITTTITTTTTTTTTSTTMTTNTSPVASSDSTSTPTTTPSTSSTTTKKSSPIISRPIRRSPSPRGAPPSAPSINYGWKMIKNLYMCGTQVMYTVFLWGTYGKDPTTDLLTYLDCLPHTSTANYLTRHCSPQCFHRHQKQTIRTNPSGDRFDISLLFLCIKVACENMAGFNDSAWHTAGPELENCLYQIKQQRNTLMHEELEMSEVEFESKARWLRQLLINTLNAAQQRYVHVSTTELAEVTKDVCDDLDVISSEPVGVDDLLMQCGPNLQADLIRGVTSHLKETFKEDAFMDPLSFLSGNRLRLQIQKIFTKIRIVKGKHQGLQPEVKFKDLFSLVQGKSARPQIMIIEGLAGSGKSTLLTLVTAEWLDGGVGTLENLDKYQLLLRIHCRDSHLSSFKDLLEDLMLPASLEYRSLLPRLVKLCRILVIVDGLDECNDQSRLLVSDIVNQLQRVSECTFLCTTRPEALQDFVHTIPKRYDVSIVQLVGIPLELRVEFVMRYFNEIRRVAELQEISLGNSKTCKELLKIMESVKRKEHFRLPLNLVMLVWLFIFKSNVVDETTTQTELYHHTHQLCQEKLDERLANNVQMKTTNKRLRQKKLKTWLQEMYRTELVTLSKNQLILSEHDVGHLRNMCSTILDLPEDEVMSAFLNMKSTWTPVDVVEQYSAPHKGLQEYYGALYVVKSLQDDPGSDSIMAVLENTIGAGQVHLSMLQNLLQQVACLLHLRLDPLPDPLAREVVDLLHAAGVTRRDQWLDILEGTKASPSILTAITHHFPVPPTLSDDDDDDDDDNIDLDDCLVRSYSKLLPRLPPTHIKIDLNGDPECLNPLLPDLPRHTCAMLQLWHHFHHPQPHPASDHIVQQVLPRGRLKVLVGQLSASVGSRLPLTLTNVRLSITTDEQAAIIPHLHSLSHLHDLSLHVGAAVTPGAVTSLPDLRDDDGGSSVFLRLSGVTEGQEERACHLIARLQPPAGFWDIWFPRATLKEDGWRTVVKGLAERGVRVEGVRVPDSLTPAQWRQLDTFARTTLHACSGVTRYDFKRRGWH